MDKCQQSDPENFGGDLTVRWLKGRLLSNRPKEDESETALELLARLRRGSATIESAVERIAPPAYSEPNPLAPNQGGGNQFRSIVSR